MLRANIIYYLLITGMLMSGLLLITMLSTAVSASMWSTFTLNRSEMLMRAVTCWRENVKYLKYWRMPEYWGQSGYWSLMLEWQKLATKLGFNIQLPNIQIWAQFGQAKLKHHWRLGYWGEFGILTIMPGSGYMGVSIALMSISTLIFGKLQYVWFRSNYYQRFKVINQFYCFWIVMLAAHSIFNPHMASSVIIQPSRRMDASKWRMWQSLPSRISFI